MATYLIFSRNGYSTSKLLLIFLIKTACQKGNLNQIDATQDAINIISLTFLLIILTASHMPPRYRHGDQERKNVAYFCVIFS